MASGSSCARRPATFWYWLGLLYGTGRHLAQLRPQRFDDLVFLRRLVVRHDDHASIAARIANVREADPRVAGGALHHGAAGFQNSAPLGVQHDPLCRAILDRTAGVHEFRLSRISQPVSSLT